MALSGLFLVVFLTQHFTINLTSVFSENIFNEISRFMGNNFIVQFILMKSNYSSYNFDLLKLFVPIFCLINYRLEYVVLNSLLLLL